MNTIEYLKEIYGYENPIILKNIRIGGKSKTAIRQELCRGYKKGLINRFSQGVYYIKKNAVSSLTGQNTSQLGFDDYIENKYIKNNLTIYPELFIYGYYSGQTFLNIIGISQQVPGKKEITTNNTSSKKRTIYIKGRYAIIRKPKIEINYRNYKYLQFLDMFHFLSDDDFNENIHLISAYIKANNFTKNELNKYLNLYPMRTLKFIFESRLINDFN